jgi:polyribonucleotide nucleotidyltransferase
MDIKIKGISYDILTSALDRAKIGRLHIIDIMEQTMAHPREEMSPYAPRITIITVPGEKIGAIIGPGGKTIKKIIDQTGVKIDIDDTGTTTIASDDLEKVQNAKNLILSMIKEPQIGEYYKGVVKRITNFGAFVEIAPGKEGMIHISEMDIARTNKITDIVNLGDLVDVLVKRIDAEGKIALSRKEYLIKNNKKTNKN